MFIEPSPLPPDPNPWTEVRNTFSYESKNNNSKDLTNDRSSQTASNDQILTEDDVRIHLQCLQYLQDPEIDTESKDKILRYLVNEGIDLSKVLFPEGQAAAGLPSSRSRVQFGVDNNSTSQQNKVTTQTIKPQSILKDSSTNLNTDRHTIIDTGDQSQSIDQDLYTKLRENFELAQKSDKERKKQAKKAYRKAENKKLSEYATALHNLNKRLDASLSLEEKEQIEHQIKAINDRIAALFIGNVRNSLTSKSIKENGQPIRKTISRPAHRAAKLANAFYNAERAYEKARITAGKSPSDRQASSVVKIAKLERDLAKLDWEIYSIKTDIAYYQGEMKVIEVLANSPIFTHITNASNELEESEELKNTVQQIAQTEMNRLEQLITESEERLEKAKEEEKQIKMEFDRLTSEKEKTPSLFSAAQINTVQQ